MRIQFSRDICYWMMANDIYPFDENRYEQIGENANCAVYAVIEIVTEGE